MINFIIGIDVVVVIFLVVLTYLNIRVFRLRGDLANKIFSYTDWIWRLEVYRTVEYQEMVWKFWKPIKPEAFYKDVSFLQPSTKPIESPFFQLKKHE